MVCIYACMHCRNLCIQPAAALQALSINLMQEREIFPTLRLLQAAYNRLCKGPHCLGRVRCTALDPCPAYEGTGKYSRCLLGTWPWRPIQQCKRLTKDLPRKSCTFCACNQQTASGTAPRRISRSATPSAASTASCPAQAHGEMATASASAA